MFLAVTYSNRRTPAPLYENNISMIALSRWTVVFGAKDFFASILYMYAKKKENRQIVLVFFFNCFFFIKSKYFSVVFFHTRKKTPFGPKTYVPQ